MRSCQNKKKKKKQEGKKKGREGVRKGKGKRENIKSELAKGSYLKE